MNKTILNSHKLLLTSILNSDNHSLCHKLFYHQSWLAVPNNSSAKWHPPLPERPPPCSPPHFSPNSDFSQKDFFVISKLLMDPVTSSGAALVLALDRTGIEPDPGLLQAIFAYFDSSPNLLYTLFLWAERNPGFQSTATLFKSIINVLAKARGFDFAWSLVLDRTGKKEGPTLVSEETFAILIRRYARAGMIQPAIRTFEFASSFDSIGNSDSEVCLFEILLDSLCKEGQVRVASEYFNRKNELGENWVPSIRIYNILLNGWFRSRKLKKAEKFWLKMKEENVRATVVTYGTLVEGYCRMRRVEMAMKFVDEMRREGIMPNAIIYNPIIDALGEAGRFEEALGMMEAFLLCESGPTISTYNSLVKGFCKAGDLVTASKTIKTMISRGLIPTPTTYNYYFRFFSKFRKTEEGMNLYTKLLEAGYCPDRLTYHLLLKMLCRDGRLNLAVQVSKEMRARGCDMDLATSTMLIHLLCKMNRYEEAFVEFKDMIRRGIVPQYLTFHRMNDELRKKGMTDMAQKLCHMMSSVPHSNKLPNTYSEDIGVSRARRRSILRKAEAISDVLKTCKDRRGFIKHRTSSEKATWIANRLIENIKRKVKET